MSASSPPSCWMYSGSSRNPLRAPKKKKLVSMIRTNEPCLKSSPGIVHGGGLVALLDAAARALASGDGPRRLEGRLTSSVPIETALDLEGHAERDVATVTILERAQPLTSATVDAGAVEDPAEAVPAEWTAAGREGWPMPLSDQCLACGA